MLPLHDFILFECLAVSMRHTASTLPHAGNMYNNTPIWSAKSVGVTPFTDPCMTEGRVMLHDGCVDKPTPDTFSCEVTGTGMQQER